MKTKFTRRLIALLLTIAMILTLVPTVFAADEKIPFTDVPEGEWYYDAVVYVYENKLMNGTSETTFEPEEQLTRGMIVTILHRVVGTPPAEKPSSFTDLTEDWYMAAVDLSLIHI